MFLRVKFPLNFDDLNILFIHVYTATVMNGGWPILCVTLIQYLEWITELFYFDL